jgi:hypothetical protein
MKVKTFIITPLISAVCAIVLNAIFHAVIMADFFDTAFAPFGTTVRPIKETNPGLLSIVEITWVCSMFYFLSLRADGHIKIKTAIIGGILINASICATWNLINLSIFSVYPVKIILPDMAWHILIIGPVIGIIMASLYNRLSK